MKFPKLKMKISINQPAFLPWANYFKRISEVDMFVLLDDVQYEKNSNINRNKIQNIITKKDLYLTIPVKKKSLKSSENLIMNSLIDYQSNWKKKHLNSLNQILGKQNNYHIIENLIHNIYSYKSENLFDFLSNQLSILLNFLEIKTKIVKSSELHTKLNKELKIIEICKTIGADEYVSGPQGINYLNKSLFDKNNIKLQYYENKNINNFFDESIINYSIIYSLSIYGKELKYFFNEK